MRFVLPLLLLLAQAAAASAGIRLETRTGATLLRLSAPACAAIRPQLDALARWNRKLGHAVEAPRCECAPDARGATVCSADASGLIPPAFRPQFARATGADGPNCWNTALRAAGLIRPARHTVAEELDFYLRSAACRELAPDEAPAPGDVIAIRDSRGEAVHAFTWISDAISLTKNGYRQGQPLTVARPEDVFAHADYRTSPRCRRTASDAVPAACRGRNRAHFHRCTPQAAPFLAAPPAMGELRLVEAWIRRQEALVSDWALNGRDAKVPLSPDTLARLEESLRSQLGALRAAGESRIGDANEKERVQALCYVLSSLLETIEYLRNPSP